MPNPYPCTKPDIHQWRTPNQWWFVAVCQTCGRAATSITDGGDAYARLVEAHQAAGPHAVYRVMPDLTHGPVLAVACSKSCGDALMGQMPPIARVLAPYTPEGGEYCRICSERLPDPR